MWPAPIPAGKMMAIRSLLAACLILFVLPAISADRPGPEDTPEFYFTRLVYSSGFGGFGRGRGSWATDYPEADVKFMWGVQRMTGIRVHPEPNTVEIMDERLFDFPYVYAVEVGRMNLRQDQADRLREYLLRGGFLHVDDFWGVYESQNFVAQMRKVFPDRKIEPVPLTHEVFHTFFDVDTVMQIPNVSNACRGGQTWEDGSDTEPGIFGIKDDDGRLMVLVTYNSDLGDAWEWMDEPCYPELYSGQAYRMGINFIIYAMTH
jgi:hypothetical protein